MASISAWQVGTSKKIGYSWTSEANTWWNVDVDYSQIEGSNNGATSGSGEYTVSAYGTYIVGLYVVKSGGGTEYQTARVTLVEPTPVPTVYATITFDNNGGTGTINDVSGSGDASSPSATTGPVTITLPSSIPSRDDGLFQGWTLNGSVYSSGATVTVTGYTNGYVYTAIAKWLLLTLSTTNTEIEATISLFEPVLYTRTLYWTIVSQDGTYSASDTELLAADSPSATYTFTNLPSNKVYIVSCAIYRTSPSTYYGTVSQTAQTSSRQVYIYSNGAWHLATPYVYSGGQWKTASANIYSNGSWH